MATFDDLIRECEAKKIRSVIKDKYESKKANGKELIEFTIFKLCNRNIDDWLDNIKRCASTDYFDHHPHHLNDEWIYVEGADEIILGEDIHEDDIRKFKDKNVYSIQVVALTTGARYEIDNIGVEDAIWPDRKVDILVEELVEYAEYNMHTAIRNETRNPVEILTIWEYWTDKSWTDCGWEYDAGMNYCGILDKNKLYILERIKSE